MTPADPSAAGTRPGHAARRKVLARTLTLRVTLLATVAVGLSVAVVAAAAYMTVRMKAMDALDESLLTRAQAAAQTNALSTLSARRVPSWALGAADVRIAFLDTGSGEIFSADRGDPVLELPPDEAPEWDVARGLKETSIRTMTAGDGQPFRIVAVPAGDGVALVLAQSLTPTLHTLESLGLVMLVVGAAGVVAAALAGWAVASNGLRPVRRLTLAAEEIARTENLVPIKVDGDPERDELARLARAFNAMLVALDAARVRQRQLVADAGHELRTPLTSLRTNLDLLAQVDRAGSTAGTPRLDPAAREELMADIRAQIGELTTLVGDLIELARDEPVAHTVEPIDLADVLARAAARVRLRAPGLEIAVSAQPWWVTGEAAALERAVTNLLDNAAKWSPPLGTVRATLERGVLQVDDEGPGIAEVDLPHVFDRFYRSAESRTMPGSGLGLSIVRQVAERHGGSATAARNPAGGARLTLTVPGTAERHEPGGAASGESHGRLRSDSVGLQARR